MTTLLFFGFYAFVFIAGMIAIISHIRYYNREEKERWGNKSNS